MKNSSLCFCIRIYFFRAGQSKPFRLHFHTDSSEVTAAEGKDVADKNELLFAPGGILGFSLAYAQVDC